MKETVRLATALISTMAAVVLGMLVSSAKSTYDARKNEVAEMSSEIVTIDRSLERYGPETGKIRIMELAISAVFFPRSFWSSTPSWLMMKVITPEFPYANCVLRDIPPIRPGLQSMQLKPLLSLLRRHSLLIMASALS